MKWKCPNSYSVYQTLICSTGSLEGHLQNLLTSFFQYPLTIYLGLHITLKAYLLYFIAAKPAPSISECQIANVVANLSLTKLN